MIPQAIAIRLALAALVVLMVVGGLEYTAHRAHKRGYAEAVAQYERKALAGRLAYEQRYAQASRTYQERLAKLRNQQEVRYVEVTKVVERPVYHNICADADGLRHIRDAFSRPPTYPGRPDAAVPGTDAPGRTNR